VTTHRRGYTRADGYRFWAYEKRNGRLREKWRSPEAFAREQLRSTDRLMRWLGGRTEVGAIA